MRCIAIDDEPMSLRVITKFCQRFDNINIETFNDPIEGMKQVELVKPDILFLDIEMGKVSGIELAKKLPQGVMLIFTTAYAQFALEGFEVNAVDFLHKPIPFARFEKAINKVKELRALQGLVKSSAVDDDTITVKVDYSTKVIRISEIQYIEAMDNYVKIHLLDSSILTQINLKGIHALLPTDKFIRIHRSHIVPIKKIASFNRKSVTLFHKGVELPIGRIYIETVQEALNINDK